MNDTYERLKAIEIEDYIWILYLVIIFLSFYANELEKKYFLCNDLKAKEDYRKLMILIFAVVLGVYYYFFEDGYKCVIVLTPRYSQNKFFFTNLHGWLRLALLDIQPARTHCVPLTTLM